MNISFVIYFHSSRLENLQQMIRLLARREDVSTCEIVLACQDRCGWYPEGFANVKCLSLALPMYRKPVLCNRGVEAASGRIIALLDSDRVLPPGWFTRAAHELPGGHILTTLNLLWCSRPHTDEEIESGRMELIPDPKSPTNEPLRKNAFSGNTVMHRTDYLSVGGMDEGFVSYGFADNDMVENCRSKGLSFIYRQDPELHLHHDKYVIINDAMIPRKEFRAYTLLNGLKFCQKWKRPPSWPLLQLLREVRRDRSPLLPEIDRLARQFRLF